MIIPISFAGKTILVTGAGRGLGKAVVHALVKNKGKVIALSMTKSKLDELKAELPSVTTLQCDLQNWKETQEAVRSIGPVHMLVNNAAINIPGLMISITSEDFEKTFHSNVRANLCVSQIVANGMIERKEGGSIVDVSSIATNKAILKQGLYGMSKSALGVMCKNFALELGPYNIRYNTINPGLFPTDMSKKALDNPKSNMVKGLLNLTALGRIGTLEEMVNPILFLLSDHSSYITGQSLYLDGGLL